jgi:trk system potassium uptake protein TrkH
MDGFKAAKPFFILCLLAVLLGFFPVIMLPPLLLAAIAGERPMIEAFVLPICVTALLAATGFFSLRKRKLNLNAKDGFLLVFITWIAASLIGTIPFRAAGLGFFDSLFESTCTFATTGGTTISDIEALPRSLLLWRSIAHWFGGIGIVFVSVALMPILGIGGFQLIKAEAPGPEKEKITPKVTDTAKLLFLAYGSLTLVLFILYLLGGMNWFDGICHAFTTMASGGASTKNSGIAAFNSPFIEGVTTVFMLLAGLNFTLYYRLLRGKINDILINTEARAYIAIFFISALVVALTLLPVYDPATALRYATYQSSSILSTTGTAIVDYETWPGLTRMILLCLMFVGGCSGSTAGGIKVIRHVVLWKQMNNELRRIIHPNGVFNIRLNRRVGRKDVIYGVTAFFCVYMAIVAITTLVTAASGVDVFSSFSAALSVTGNIGTGFGAIGPSRNYGAFANHIKLLYSLVMIAGRLELWTVILLFHPSFWRR